MKKALWCEVKRNLLPLVIFAAIALIVGVSYTSTMELCVGAFASFRYDSGLACYAVLLCVLCTVVPVMQFFYRMKQRSVDLWYSLPITRKQLVLVRTLAGLLLVFVPFTIAYWPGVAIVAMRCNELASSVRGFHFQYIHYLSCFAQMLLLGTCLFGVNAFLFTRGNSMFDGIFFILGWAILVPLFVSAFRRTNDLAMAMEARCYHGGEGRTKMKPLKYKTRDRMAYVITVVYVAAVFAAGRFIDFTLWIF